MKGFFKTLLAIVLWVICSSVAAFIVTNVLAWLTNAFKIETTFGSIIFLILTMPEVMGLSFWIVLMIGASLLTTKAQGIAYLIIVGIWQGSFLLTNYTNVTMWCVFIATLFALIIVLFNASSKEIELKQQQEEEYKEQLKAEIIDSLQNESR